MTIFVNGRQKSVRRPQLIDGMSVDDFIARNADPLWLHQNEMWELMPLDTDAETAEDFPGLLHSQISNPLVSDQAVINETPQPTRKHCYGQGSEEIPF